MIELSRAQTHVAVATGLAILVAATLAVSCDLSRAAVYLVLSLFCVVAIGFADALGGTTGWGGPDGPRVNVASPEWLVRFMGWILLLALSILTLLAACSGDV